MGKDFARMISNYFIVDEIWLLARRKEKLIILAHELEQNNRKNISDKIPHARAIELNISGREGISKLKALIEEEKKLEEKDGELEISVLINNAGFGTYGTFEDTELSKELDMIDLNCVALTGICGICLPFLKKDSVIINTASLASFLPLGNFAVYGATKAYVLSFTIALAAELKEKGIKVCALCPGPVSTEFANIASNGSRKTVKHGLQSNKVVEHCLKKATKGKHIAIYALKWKLKAWASSFVDRYLGALFTFKYCKRPNGKNGIE